MEDNMDIMINQSSKDRACLTQNYAEIRSRQVNNVSYKLHFVFEENSEKYNGFIQIKFNLNDDQQNAQQHNENQQNYLMLDYAGKSISQFIINQTPVIPEQNMWQDNFLRINFKLLQRQNIVEIKFQGVFHNDGLGIKQVQQMTNDVQNTIIYTLFPTNNAHRVFPCFDQPDIKAKFSLLIDCPKTWSVVSNEMEQFIELIDHISKNEMKNESIQLSRWSFDETPLISTYLFTFVIGNLGKIEREIQYGENNDKKIKLRLFCRYRYNGYLPQQIEEISFLIQNGLTFYEKIFQTPYPFSAKYDQVFCPHFHYIGMENPGVVCFTENYIFTEQKSKNLLTSRASSILHELSHMWFGNLVTMKWWNDIWLNEGFATYISYLCLSEVEKFRERYVNPWVKFCEYKSSGFSEDSKLSTHSIAQEIQSTDVSMEIYDSITYSKGSGILKQLVFLIGMSSFQSFMQQYFQKFKWQNASMHDFFSMIKQVVKQDKKFENFNIEMWIDQYICKPSFNVISFKQDPKSNTITFYQRPYHEKYHQYKRFQSFKVRVYNSPFFSGGHQDLDVFFSEQQITLNLNYNQSSNENNGQMEIEYQNPQQKCVLVNYEDQSYIKFELDEFSRNNFLKYFADINDELSQITLLQHFIGEVQSGQLAAQQFVSSFLLVLDKTINNPNIFTQTVECLYTLIDMLPREIQIIETEKVFNFLLQKFESTQLLPMIVQSITDKISWFGQTESAQTIMKSWILNQYQPLKQYKWNNYVLTHTLDYMFFYKHFTKEERQDFLQQKLQVGNIYRQFCNICEYSKEEMINLWNQFLSKTYQDSSVMYDMTLQMKAFNNPTNQEIQQFLLEAFFSNLEQIFRESNQEYAKRFYQKLFPKSIDTDILFKKVDDMLKKEDIPIILKNFLNQSYSKLEEQQKILRKYKQYSQENYNN